MVEVLSIVWDGLRMAETKTVRVQLPQWSEGSDPRPDRAKTNAIHQAIENQMVIDVPAGLLKDRPVQGVRGRLYCATDQGSDGRVYYDNGTTWVALNTTGGGGPGLPIVINGTGTEGSSLQSARADHTHAIPLATKSNAGAMPSQWAELCENATASATANTVAVRDSGGRLISQKPTSAQHVATMDWVNTDAGSTAPGPATLARRDVAGRINVAMPVTANHATPKAYVDDRVQPMERYAIGNTGIMRWSTGVGGNVEDPDNPLTIANRRYVDSRSSRREWKTNIRENPYGLDEILQVDTYLYDYKDGAPAVGTDEIGPMVDELARVMPLLTTDGDDGAPERVRDRAFIPVLIQAIQELAQRVDELSVELEDCYERVGGDYDA